MAQPIAFDIEVAGFHWDEVDEIPPEIMAASIGTLNSLPGVPARTVATSTWHHAHGPMGELVANADERRIKLHKWNIWESIKRCPLARHENGRGCRQCPLEAPCLAKARERGAGAEVGVASEARCGLFAIDDVIRQYCQWSQEQWEAEAECRRPTWCTRSSTARGTSWRTWDSRLTCPRAGPSTGA